MAAPAAAMAPPPAPAPAPAAPPPPFVMKKKRRSRLFLSEADKLHLTRLCVQHQELYGTRKKGDFWDIIKHKYHQETGESPQFLYFFSFFVIHFPLFPFLSKFHNSFR
jgi:hypothetical protein